MNITFTLSVPNEPDRTLSLPLPINRNWGKQWGQFSASRVPNLLGTHLYTRAINDHIFECELSINNGVIPFLGKLYFNQIKAELSDQGWEIRTFSVPYSNVSGSTWTIVTNNTLNVFLPKWYLKRRFVICKVGTTTAESERVLKYTDVRIPNLVTNYGPFNMTQPTTNRVAEAARCNTNNNTILAGMSAGDIIYIQYITNVLGGSFGPWIPDGENPGGAPAGDGIYPYTGFEQCKEAILMHRLMYGLNWDRHPIACYKSDGTPYRLEDFPNFNSSVPQLIRVGPKIGQIELTLFLDGSYDTYSYRIYNSAYNGQCPYESGLWAYDAYDIAHLRRCSHNGEVVSHYTSNPMIEEDMDVVTEYIRAFGWGDRPDSKVVPAYLGDFVPHTLSSILHYVQSNPHAGVGVDRAFGWAMYHHALLHKLRPNETFTANWINPALQLYSLGVDSHGILAREFHQPYLPPGVEGIQSFHTAIIGLGAIAASRVVNSTLIGDILVNLANNLYFTLGTKPYQYDVNEFGPPHWLWTYNQGVYIDPLDVNLGDPNGDPTHVISFMTEIYRFTNNINVLNWSLVQWYPVDTLAERKAQLDVVDWSQKNQTAGTQSVVDKLV